MTDLLKMLHDERTSTAKRLAGIDAAIQALNGNTQPKATKKRTWTMSAEARAKISAAAKRRWAKIKR
jgi:hypothetical protein